MPKAKWSAKRERQYEHVKDSVLDQGKPPREAAEVAARTVNKARARAGESETASDTSIHDLSSGRRGGLRSHQGSGGRTFRQLYAEAQAKGIPGRSTMDKAALLAAVGRR